MCCCRFSCSFFLYTYDKMVAPNVSLRREAEMNPEMLGALLKHYGRRVLGHDEPPMGETATPPDTPREHLSPECLISSHGTK